MQVQGRADRLNFEHIFLPATRLRAERRSGVLLAELARVDKAEAGKLGGHAKAGTSTAETCQQSPYAQALADTGMTRQTSHRFRWQLRSVAAVDAATTQAGRPGVEVQVVQGQPSRFKAETKLSERFLLDLANPLSRAAQRAADRRQGHAAVVAFVVAGRHMRLLHEDDPVRFGGWDNALAKVSRAASLRPPWS